MTWPEKEFTNANVDFEKTHRQRFHTFGLTGRMFACDKVCLQEIFCSVISGRSRRPAQKYQQKCFSFSLVPLKCSFSFVTISFQDWPCFSLWPCPTRRERWLQIAKEKKRPLLPCECKSYNLVFWINSWILKVGASFSISLMIECYIDLEEHKRNNIHSLLKYSHTHINRIYKEYSV